MNSSVTCANLFFSEHPVFSVGEFDAFLASCPSSNTPALSVPDRRNSLLHYHQARGHVVRVRRGLYAAVPPGKAPESHPVDTFLVASRMTPDAVLGYHTALSIHGIAQSLREERIVVSAQSLVRPFLFRGVAYRAVQPPLALLTGGDQGRGVETQDRLGLAVRVTTLERTIVDVLDRPVLCGGWEEVWRSLEGIDVYLGAEQIVSYALLLGNATTAAKVGYFLQEHRARLQIPGSAIEALRTHIPGQPSYVERGQRSNARLVKGWNLMIPSAPGSELSCGDDGSGEIPV